MSEQILDMISEFEDVAKKWVNECWSDSNIVEIDDQTWQHRDSDTWPWHEVVEKTVPPVRGTIPYPSGISWEIEDVSIEVEPEFKPTMAYEKRFVNDTSGELEVTEDWSDARTIKNSQSIKLDQRVSFGSELTTKAGINIKAVEVGFEAKSTMSMELGASQSIEKEESSEVSFGHSITFKVPAGKTYKINFFLDKGERDVDFKMKSKASGWIYFRTSYRSKAYVGIDRHVYPWKIYGEGPQGIPQGRDRPMPDKMRTFEISGKYTHTKYLGGRFIITDETGADITKQVQIRTVP